MTFNSLYNTECLILAVKSLIFCVLMNISSHESVERHCIYEEFRCQDHIKQCNLFQFYWCLYDDVDAIKCFNWIYILISNKFIIVCSWAFKLKSRMIIANIEISTWVNYLCVSQLITDLINNKEDYKESNHHQKHWSLFLLIFWELWYYNYIYLLDFLICLPSFELNYLFELQISYYLIIHYLLNLFI